MSPRKPGARKTRPTKRLSLSRNTIKDLTPPSREVKGGIGVTKTKTVQPTLASQQCSISCRAGRAC